MNFPKFGCDWVNTPQESPERRRQRAAIEKLDQLRDAVNAPVRRWGECDDCHRERVQVVMLPWTEGAEEWDVCIPCSARHCRNLLKAAGLKIGEY